MWRSPKWPRSSPSCSATTCHKLKSFTRRQLFEVVLMSERYYAGAYWGVRPETAAECAEHALIFFKELQRIDPAWEQWCRTGRLRRGEPRITGKVDDKQELEELFRRGRNRA